MSKKTLEIFFLENTVWGKKEQKKTVKRGFAFWLIDNKKAVLTSERVEKFIENKKQLEEQKN